MQCGKKSFILTDIHTEDKSNSAGGEVTVSEQLREDAERIIYAAIEAAMPEQAVKNALGVCTFGPGKTVLIAVGKAAWTMAESAYRVLGGNIFSGAVITKYGHSKGPIGPLEIYEAGHPVPDENSFVAAERVVNIVSGLSEKDTVLFLISGGGSALFEIPLISWDRIQKLTNELLRCGADIKEINTVRKHLSAVKGGRFAEICSPAKVLSVILSDVLGDPLDMIASGPAYPDSTTSEQALSILRKYGLSVSEEILSALKKETPKSLSNVEAYVSGSVRQLCDSAEKTAASLGYTPIILTDSLCCTARDAGVFLSNIAQKYSGCGKSMAFICGGETVVKLTGSGCGGRNQELALAAAEGISGMDNVAVFSIGSDGTDGPTDAAGGYVDGKTKSRLDDLEIDIHCVLAQNDSYYALEKTGGLIITGPTGTNVNDLSVLLIR